MMPQRKSTDYDDLDSGKRMVPRSQVMTSQVGTRPNKKGMIKVMDSEERPGGQERKSALPETMHGSQPEISSVHMIKTTISKQMNSVVDTDYANKDQLNQSASPAQTNKLNDANKSGGNQSSAFSVHMQRGSLVASHPEVPLVKV